MGTNPEMVLPLESTESRQQLEMFVMCDVMNASWHMP